MRDLLGKHIRVNVGLLYDYDKHAAIYAQKYPEAARHIGICRPSTVYTLNLVLTEVRDDTLIVKNSTRTQKITYAITSGPGIFIAMGSLYVQPGTWSATPSLYPLPFFVPPRLPDTVAPRPPTETSVVKEYSAAELRKHNTRPGVSVCCKCGRPLSNPLPPDPTYQHCKTCEA